MMVDLPLLLLSLFKIYTCNGCNNPNIILQYTIKDKRIFMKLWLVMAFALFFFSGCSFDTQKVRLQKINKKQSLLIQEQQAQIAALQKKLSKRRIRKRKKVKVKVKVNNIPTAPKKNITLKKVEDTNYSSGYMYPGAKKKKKKKKKPAPKVALANITQNQKKTSSVAMGKPECIAMIGQTKFDKYTKMFGSESASIKRCNMLKAMR